MFEELTIDRYHQQLLDGSMTTVDLVQWYLARIAEFSDGPDGLNAVTTVNPRVLEEARACDERRAAGSGPLPPLHGVPVLVKDQAETAGIRTTFGSRLFEGYVPEADATVVARLRAAGAVILGKTTMCDFAAGWFSASSLTGHTRNAYDRERDSGGSSAGSGTAVGANLCLVAIGEDTGGSIRIPASFNNAFGLRVTTGLVPRTGFSPLVHFQDTAGPMARTARDLATVLEVITGYDPADPYSVVATQTDTTGYRAALDAPTDLGAWSFGVLATAFGPDDDARCAAVNEVVCRALDDVTAAGTTVVGGLELDDLPGWIGRTSVYGRVSKTDLSRFLASRAASPVEDYAQLYASGVFHPENDLFHDMAAGPEDVESDVAYLQMRINQDHFRRHVLRLFAEYGVDVLVYPTVQVPPPTFEDLADGVYTALTFPTNTVIASQAGLPALTVPAGFTADGLPVGLEVVARPFAETTLLQVAAGLEELLGARRSPSVPTTVGAGAVDAR